MNKHERFDAQAHIDADENPFTCSGDVAGFTGDKLDWLTALSADPRIDARAFEVGFCIMQHVNKRTRTAFVSTETISEKTGIPVRYVERARATLRKAGWMTWRRTGTANVYSPLDGPMNAILDQQTLLKDQRDERRKQHPVRRFRSATGGGRTP